MSREGEKRGKEEMKSDENLRTDKIFSLKTLENIFLNPLPSF